MRDDRDADADDELGDEVWVHFCPNCGKDLRDAGPAELGMWVEYDSDDQRAQVRCRDCKLQIDLRLNGITPDAQIMEELRERQLRNDRSTV